MSGISKRGFASLSEAQKKLIASLGGRAAHATGRAHEWTSEEARLAGRKGGLESARRKKLKKEQEEATPTPAVA